MKTMQQVLMILVVFLSITACSKWNQDPLTGQSDLLRDPQQAPKEQEKPKDPESDASVKVDTVSFYNYTEGVEGEFEISARVLRPDFTYEIVVDNLDQFPGAVYNPSTKRFTWTPPRGTVSESDGVVLHRSLKVIAYAISAEGNRQYYAESTVLMTIDKVYDAPKIVSALPSKALLREGESMLVTLRVTDYDAGPTPDTWPTVMVLPVKDQVNLAQYAVLQSTTMTSSHHFEIVLKVDLTNALIGIDFQDGGLIVAAFSKYAKRSVEQNVPITIASKLTAPKSTWNKIVEVTTTKTFITQFTFFDPTDSSYISAPKWTNLPPEATMDCSNSSGTYATEQNCVFTWIPRPTTKPAYRTDIKATLEYRKRGNQDPLKDKVEIQFSIRVVAGVQELLQVSDGSAK